MYAAPFPPSPPPHRQMCDVLDVDAIVIHTSTNALPCLQMCDVLGMDASHALLTSAKTGKGLEAVLPAVIE